MKILIICNNLSLPYVNMSGVSVVHKLIKKLQTVEDFELTILSSRGKDTKPLSNIYYINSSSLVISRLFIFIKAFTLIRKNKYNLVVDFNSLPILCLFLAVYRYVLGIKVVSVNITVNESFLGSYFPRWLMSLVSAFVFTDFTTYKKHGITKNSVFCPIAFDFKTVLNLPFPNYSNKQIFFLGPLDKRKGLHILLKTLPLITKQFRDVKLVIGSFGREVRDRHFKIRKTRFLEIIRKSRIEFSFLEGQLDVLGLFRESSIFVYPSISRHGTLGQPLTLLEAMAAGLLCVVSDIYNQENFLVGNDNCVFFKSGDSADLAEKMIEVLNNQSTRFRLGLNARNEIKNKYISGECIKSWLSIIRL